MHIQRCRNCFLQERDENILDVIIGNAVEGMTTVCDFLKTF